MINTLLALQRHYLEKNFWALSVDFKKDQVIYYHQCFRITEIENKGYYYLIRYTEVLNSNPAKRFSEIIREWKNYYEIKGTQIKISRIYELSH